MIRLRNHPDGYGAVTKVLHWMTAVLLLAQFLVGYSMHRFEAPLEWAVDRWFDGEEEALLPIHVVLGVSILVVASVRLSWRKVAGLPEWAAGLSDVERRVEHRVEQVLYAMLFLIPFTGLSLLLVSGQDWDLGGDREWPAPLDWVDDDLLLGAHIASHLAFFVALIVHVGLVLKHQFVDRDRLLNRML